VLATSIAETSLTIEGVRVVIDSGAMRVPRFSPRSGMSRLETVRVTRASADQRRGRAGRVAPGIAYRLWSEHEEAGLLPFNRPEILETDLAPLVLALADAGVGDPAQLAWLDPPPAAAYSQARELLVQLGALDVSGAITAHGRKIAQLPMHPRLAHMLIAAPRGLEDVACDVAAVLGERDVLRGMDGPPDADLRLRLELVSQRGGDQREQLHGMTVDRDALRRVREIARELRQWRDNQLPSPPMTGASVPPPGRVVDGAGTLLALAYPDRIAQRRTTEPEPTGRTVRADMRRHGGRFLLRNGRGVVLPSQGALSAAPYLAVAELDDQRPEGRILLAAPLETEDLELVAGSSINTEDSIAWDAAARAVVARRRRMLGAIVIAESALHEPDPALVTTALLDAVRSNGIDALPWNDSARRLRQRIAFAASLEPGWPDVSDAALDRSLEDWLAPHLAGRRRWSDVERLDLGALLSGMLDWRQRSTLDEIAPTHLGVPSGSRIPIDYADPAAPSVSVRLQEMFGATETPRVGRGRIPLTIQLLSPAHRPVQVTRDLAGFWRTTYFDVRKDLRGRYPKHHWPDDPLTAPPTNRAKRRT
jgi:ATP-dependent helicase HrpB